MLVMVTGLPGTGKTTFAKALAKRINGVHINSDMIRVQLGKKGQYDTTSKTAVYEALQGQAEALLKQKKIVVVDATLYKNTLRELFKKLADKYKTPVKWIVLKAEEPIIKERVNKKREYSEADFEVYLKIKADYEPMEMSHLTLWSDSLGKEEMVEKAEEFLDLG